MAPEIEPRCYRSDPITWACFLGFALVLLLLGGRGLVGPHGSVVRVGGAAVVAIGGLLGYFGLKAALLRVVVGPLGLSVGRCSFGWDALESWTVVPQLPPNEEGVVHMEAVFRVSTRPEPVVVSNTQIRSFDEFVRDVRRCAGAKESLC